MCRPANIVASRPDDRPAFTLVELLIVLGIVAALVGILLPALGRARSAARQAACATNLRQVGAAVVAYAADHRGSIPYGPKAPLFTATNFYPRTGNVTSLVSLDSGAPVGLGLLLRSYLAATKRSLFCHDADQGSIADEMLALVGRGQAQCDYYYRHASGGSLLVDADTSHLRLADLGVNSAGVPIQALAIDVNFLAVPGLAGFGGFQRTSHGLRNVNALFADGSVRTGDNRGGEFTVDTRQNIDQSFAKILAVLERADGL